MASEQLKQTLLDLHARLAAGEHLDPELRGLLQLLETDIHARLRTGAAVADGVATADAATSPTMASLPASGTVDATPAPYVPDTRSALMPSATLPGAPPPGESVPTANPAHATGLPADAAAALPHQARRSSEMGSTVEALTDPTTSGLSSRAQEISARFAAAHPHLEPVLRELTDTLQRIGI